MRREYFLAPLRGAADILMRGPLRPAEMATEMFDAKFVAEVTFARWPRLRVDIRARTLPARICHISSMRYAPDFGFLHVFDGRYIC